MGGSIRCYFGFVFMVGKNADFGLALAMVRLDFDFLVLLLFVFVRVPFLGIGIFDFLDLQTSPFLLPAVDLGDFVLEDFVFHFDFLPFHFEHEDFLLVLRSALVLIIKLQRRVVVFDFGQSLLMVAIRNPVNQLVGFRLILHGKLYNNNIRQPSIKLILQG